MKKAIKIIGICATVLLILIAISPTFLASTEESIIINEGGEGNGENEEEEDLQECEWQVNITETYDEEIDWALGLGWGSSRQYTSINLISDGGIVTGIADAYDDCIDTAYISGAVTSTKQIHIYRECPPGVMDDCCCSVMVVMQPQFTLKVEKHGNARAEASGLLRIETQGCSATTSGGISVGSLQGSEVGIDFNLDGFKITKYPGDSKEVDFADIETCIIEDCDIVIDVLGSGALSVAADGHPLGPGFSGGWPLTIWFDYASSRAEILDWDLGLTISTSCDCDDGGEWAPLILPE